MRESNSDSNRLLSGMDVEARAETEPQTVEPARLIEARCASCDWNGKCLNTELDEACWNCGEWESLYEVDPDDEPDDID